MTGHFVTVSVAEPRHSYDKTTADVAPPYGARMPGGFEGGVLVPTLATKFALPDLLSTGLLHVYLVYFLYWKIPIAIGTKTLFFYFASLRFCEINIFSVFALLREKPFHVISG
jgi:hypothetical protein